MKKSNSGIIAILANYNTQEMRKVLDLKITSGYPTVTIPSNFEVQIPEQKMTIHGYQHITIPPDLNVHLTGNGKKRIWSPKKDLLTPDGKLNKKFQKILSMVFPPISDFPIFTDRSYKGAEIIGFSQMPHWTENTSFVLELFAQQTANEMIPNQQHYTGEQGAYMPWQYSDLGKTYNEPYKQGSFWIRQFAITNHEPKQHKVVTVHFWDYLS